MNEKNNTNNQKSTGEKAVHIAGQQASNYIAPGVGKHLYNAASKTPIGKKAEKKLGEQIDSKIGGKGFNPNAIQRPFQGTPNRNQASKDLQKINQNKQFNRQQVRNQSQESFRERERREAEEDKNNHPISNLNSSSGPHVDKEEREKNENSHSNKLSKSLSPLSGASGLIAKGLNGALRALGINANIKPWQVTLGLVVTCVFLFFLILLLIVAAVLQPFIIVGEILGIGGDGGSASGDSDNEITIGTVGQSLWNFVTGNGFYTDEDSFYKKLESVEEEYQEKGVTIDMPLIVSISFYANPGISEEECDLGDENCITVESDYDYSDMRDDIDELAKNMVNDNDGVLTAKTDDEIKEWLRESDFIKEKFEDLGYEVPSDDAKWTQKEEEFISDCWGRRKLYLTLFGHDESSNNMCLNNVEIDDSQKKKIRLTSYQWTPNGREKSLGGTLGLVQPYVNDGTIYFDENGYAMWKGGTISKNDKKVYGETGTDYVIVATATRMLIGDYGYVENDKIRYFAYNEAFTLQISPDGGKNYKTYNAIVLDSCGACMDWSVTSNGRYAPKNLSNPTKQLQYCRETNNMKIDLFTNYQNVKNPADTAYFIEGLNGANCANGDFEEWKQIDPKWKDIKIGKSNSTVGEVGCLITSISMQLMRSGVDLTVDNFNPGVAAKKFSFQGANLVWESVSNVAPSFSYMGKVNLRGKSKAEKIEITSNLVNQGYYVVANVKNGGHWVAVTGVGNNTIYMSDPGSYNAGNDLFARYPEGNSSKRLIQLAYYKVK